MINNKLEILYKSKWDILSNSMVSINSDDTKNLKASNPLLIRLDEEKFKNADKIIMFFGQETNSWYGDFNKDMNYSLEKYTEFYSSDYCFKYGGHFWNGIKKLKSKIKNKYPDQNIYFIFCNICRIGNSQRDTNTPATYIFEEENKIIEMYKEELDIINPDNLIFFTGPNYDWCIERSYGSFDKKVIDGFTINELIEFSLAEKKCHRTYHPNYLYRKSGRIDQHLDYIVSQI